MTKLNQLAMLLENDLDQARLILAATHINDQVQKKVEDIAKLSINDVMPLVDEMRDVFGVEKTEKFETAVNEALDSALDALKDAKDKIHNEVARLEGKETSDELSSDMTKDENNQIDDTPDAGDEESEDNDDATGLDDINLDDIELDDFGGANIGDENEPLGRSKKE